jgi:hypothetical protein
MFRRTAILTDDPQLNISIDGKEYGTGISLELADALTEIGEGFVHIMKCNHPHVVELSSSMAGAMLCGGEWVKKAVAVILEYEDRLERAERKNG